MFGGRMYGKTDLKYLINLLSSTFSFKTVYYILFYNGNSSPLNFILNDQRGLQISVFCYYKMTNENISYIPFFPVHFTRNPTDFRRPLTGITNTINRSSLIID
jgi:hypothetical protein